MSLPEQVRPWISIRLPTLELAASLSGEFGREWGERGVDIEMPDWFEYTIARKPLGKDPEDVVGVVEAWLLQTPLESLTVSVSDGAAIEACASGAHAPRESTSSLMVLPEGPEYLAVLKVEDETETGQPVGMLTLEDGDGPVWTAAEWMSESDAIALAKSKGWRLELDQ